jgi:hypothetical protein
MNIWPLNNISQEEKNDILSKHKSIYNGYQIMQTNASNTQPLYVQDFATDKEGMVINNKGNVKKYTNYGINESKERESCNECGGRIMEGECQECGTQYEGECLDCVEETMEIDEFAAPILRAAATGAGSALANKAFDYITNNKDETQPDWDAIENLDYDEELDDLDYNDEFDDLDYNDEFDDLDYDEELDDLDYDEELDEESEWKSIKPSDFEDYSLIESFKLEKRHILEMMNRMKKF